MPRSRSGIYNLPPHVMLAFADSEKAVTKYFIFRLENEFPQLVFENEDLNKQLFDLERKKLLSLNTSNIYAIYDSIIFILSKWDKLNITDKQIYMQKIIDCIVWDGADGLNINLK